MCWVSTSSYYVEFYNESFPFSINTHTKFSCYDEKSERENRHENPQLSDELHTDMYREKGEDII